MKAASHMEIFHQLARKHNWHTDSGDSYHEIVCEHLRRIYTSIAEEVQILRKIFVMIVLYYCG